MPNPVQLIQTTDITSHNKCDYCSALCCSYITQELGTLRTMAEFDTLLWQVAHKDIHVFKDDNGWYLLSMTRCEYVMPDNRCGIYEKRPLICREHSFDACEKDVPINEGCQYYFTNFEELDAYCRKRFKTWDKRIEKFEAAKSE